MRRPTASDIVARASEAAFGRPLVSNTLRSMVVEAMVDLALGDGWTWCSADFAGWDFEHADGTRLEVKQSAARQTWAAPARQAPPRFDIAPRTGHWAGPTWIEGAGRQAHIYVLAHHPLTDETADHRDPQQWVFYVVAADMLPAAKSLSLKGAEALTIAVDYVGLRDMVERVRIVCRGGSPLHRLRRSPEGADHRPLQRPRRARRSPG
ncbi:hypothetical protein [Phenylobacterium sp.]|uniref:hypothetical protein n=1 Tax=Phenylobacterium sp. TaxID=1871053 RepID=UPI003D27210B